MVSSTEFLLYLEPPFIDSNAVSQFSKISIRANPTLRSFSFSFFLGGRNVDDAIRSWFDTGVTDKSKLRIGPAEYYPDAAVNESASKYSSIAEKLAKDLKEGLPKGFFDKAMDAKDEKPKNESYDTLVNKIKKQGKSSKAAKAIAGAVASYKAKGGGKGPTAKQK